MLHRGHNAKTQPGRNEGVAVELEMAALEDLGPLARMAICNSPLHTLAYALITQVIERNDKIEVENEQRAAQGLSMRPYVDPKEPKLDALFAQFVVNNNFQLLKRERSIEDARAGVIPMQGRQSAKSLREQRRSDRASRRMMR